jgi:hypothetical protein
MANEENAGAVLKLTYPLSSSVSSNWDVLQPQAKGTTIQVEIDGDGSPSVSIDSSVLTLTYAVTQGTICQTAEDGVTTVSLECRTGPPSVALTLTPTLNQESADKGASSSVLSNPSSSTVSTVKWWLMFFLTLM